MWFQVHRVHVLVFVERERETTDRLGTIPVREVVAERFIVEEIQRCHDGTFLGLAFENEFAALESGHARHDLGTTCMFFLGEEVVVVQQLAIV